MPNIVTYKDPHYCLIYGSSTVFLDIEVEIIQEHGVHGKYSVGVTSWAFDESEETFNLFLLSLMTPTQIDLLHNEVCRRLIDDLTPSLFSLFYTNEQNANIPPTITD